jgi:mycoredoxin
MAAITSLSSPSGAGRRSTVPVVVYGRRWCAISQMVRRYLDRIGVPYEYVDLDAHPEVEARLGWLTGGRVHSPVVSVGGDLLVRPSIRELELTLRRRGALERQGVTT